MMCLADCFVGSFAAFWRFMYDAVILYVFFLSSLTNAGECLIFI